MTKDFKIETQKYSNNAITALKWKFFVLYETFHFAKFKGVDSKNSTLKHPEKTILVEGLKVFFFFFCTKLSSFSNIGNSLFKEVVA